jgi:hypothetical protein
MFKFVARVGRSGMTCWLAQARIVNCCNRPMHSLMKFWEYRRPHGSYPEPGFAETKRASAFDRPRFPQEDFWPATFKSLSRLNFRVARHPPTTVSLLPKGASKPRLKGGSKSRISLCPVLSHAD